MQRTCSVKIKQWEEGEGLLPIVFEIFCRRCDRTLGTWSKHESAMEWARVHAGSKKHIPGR